MEKEFVQTKTFIVSDNLIETVRHLLSDGWRKLENYCFFKERNNYVLKIDGSKHPMWQIEVKPKTNEFDNNDWKLRQDMRNLLQLGKEGHRKKLYVNDKNRKDITNLISMMKQNNYNLIFNNEYILFRTKSNSVKIFKIAAAIDLVEQLDGWYVGQKRMF